MAFFLQIPSFFNDVQKLNEQIVSEALSDASSLILVAKLIGGLGLLISILFTYKKILQGGLEEETWKFGGKLIAIFLGIVFYGTFVRTINIPLDLMANAVKSKSLINDQATENYFNSFSFQDYDEYSSDPVMEAELSRLKLEIEEKGELTRSERRDISNERRSIQNRSSKRQDEKGVGIWDFIGGEGLGSVKRYLMQSVYKITFMLGQIAIMVLNFVRTFFLTVLSVFGIFAIAFSAYPGFEGTFNKWLQNYINVYIWLPISYILQSIISKMYMNFNPVDVEGQFSVDNPTMMIFGIISIVSYATVPVMSSWMISAATNQLASKVRGKSEQLGKSAASKGQRLGKVGTMIKPKKN